MGVSQTDRCLLLIAWISVHMWALHWVVHVLDSDIKRRKQSAGWSAAHPLALLVVINTAVYLAVFCCSSGNIQTHIKHIKGVPVKESDLMFGSALLQPVKHNRVAPASFYKMLKDGQPPLIIPVLATKAGDEGEAGEVLPRHTTYCTCPNRQGLRIYHCRECGTCIQGFDHHCFWLSCCIGAHNHSWFFVYLATQSSLCLYGLHQVLTALKRTAHAATVWQLVVIAAFAGFMIVVNVLMFCMFGFHSFLILTNWKTYELLKGPPLHPIWTDLRSPFDRGVCQNLWNFIVDQQLYNTIVDGGQLDGPWRDGGHQQTIWDNSFYSCC